MTSPSVDAPVQASTVSHPVRRPGPEGWQVAADTLAREEPLEVRVRARGWERRLGLLLRTPGRDRELVAGLLYAEGIVDRRADLVGLSFEPASGEAQEFNGVVADLAPTVEVDWERVGRPLVMTAACGVCGRAMLSALHDHVPRPAPAQFRVTRDVLARLPDELRARQSVFERTGGLHAAALFRADGTLVRVEEDVGRHNAVDKLVGESFLADALPLSANGLLVSGRAGYEIVQKAVRAGIGFVAAVGAPSSLAVETASEFRVALVGFLRGDRFNVYVGHERF